MGGGALPPPPPSFSSSHSRPLPLSLSRRVTGTAQVTGTIFSGDMCAVMGPSGAGKTTLLDIISKRKTEGKIHGKV